MQQASKRTQNNRRSSERGDDYQNEIEFVKHTMDETKQKNEFTATNTHQIQ